MVMELDWAAGTPVNTVLRKYTWGRDLGGVGILPASLEAAGGIGGLLAVEDTNATTTTTDDQSLAFCYEANGNVGQVVDWAQTTASAALKAKYEYDVYGNVTSSGGSYVTANPFRFSTKCWDDETGLGYWGYRYYEPRMGRWISRDPKGETASLNLFAYVNNSPPKLIDPLGLDWCESNCECGEKKCQVELRVSFLPPDANEKFERITDAVGDAGDIVGAAGIRPGDFGEACDAVLDPPDGADAIRKCGKAYLQAVEDTSATKSVWVRAWNKTCERQSCWWIWSVCRWGADRPTSWKEVPSDVIPRNILSHECASDEEVEKATEWAKETLCE